MKSNVIVVSALAAFAAAGAFAADAAALLDRSPDRVRTPLRVDMARIGTIRPRGTDEIRASNWTIGCECLDRDVLTFADYRAYLRPLGIKRIRLQAGWAKCEKTKGVYDFAWLDEIVDYAAANGMRALLETDYGNPIYAGGGTAYLGADLPSGAEAEAAWDAWVDALSRHFAGRVRDWAMWNEPDILDRWAADGTIERRAERQSPAAIAAFNVRTARIIKRNIPDARIGALSLAQNDPAFLEACLRAMGADAALFDRFVYHGYAANPESSYENVEAQKAVVARYAPHARLRQGENGCPSAWVPKSGLKRWPWSEWSQAKWDLRRMLGDLGHDVESSVFTLCDFSAKENKGLIAVDFDKKPIHVKRAYYAVQHVAAVFDDALVRRDRGVFVNRDATLAVYEYGRADGEGFPLCVFWDQGDAKKTRPSDSFQTRPVTFRVLTDRRDARFVWADLLSGRVYAVPERNVHPSVRGVYLTDVPAYDSPCILAERAAFSGFMNLDKEDVK